VRLFRRMGHRPPVAGRRGSTGGRRWHRRTGRPGPGRSPATQWDPARYLRLRRIRRARRIPRALRSLPTPSLVRSQLVTRYPPGISGPLPPAVADHIAAVVLFGTPREWIINIADNSAPPIAIGSSLSARTVEFCATGDPVGSPGGLDRAAHGAYKVNGMVDEAGVFAANALSAG
jgi:hypothetical protein